MLASLRWIVYWHRLERNPHWPITSVLRIGSSGHGHPSHEHDPVVLREGRRHEDWHSLASVRSCVLRGYGNRIILGLPNGHPLHLRWSRGLSRLKDVERKRFAAKHPAWHFALLDESHRHNTPHGRSYADHSDAH